MNAARRYAARLTTASELPGARVWRRRAWLSLHWPDLAQLPHETSVSSQVCVHVAQECGHSTARYSAFLPEHSPSLAQWAHDVDLSLQ